MCTGRTGVLISIKTRYILSNRINGDVAEDDARSRRAIARALGHLIQPVLERVRSNRNTQPDRGRDVSAAAELDSGAGGC